MVRFHWLGDLPWSDPHLCFGTATDQRRELSYGHLTVEELWKPVSREDYGESKALQHTTHYILPKIWHCSLSSEWMIKPVASNHDGIQADDNALWKFAEQEGGCKSFIKMTTYGYLGRMWIYAGTPQYSLPSAYNRSCDSTVYILPSSFTIMMFDHLRAFDRIWNNEDRFAKQHKNCCHSMQVSSLCPCDNANYSSILNLYIKKILHHGDIHTWIWYSMHVIVDKPSYTCT